jgi:hypothetical protein
MARIHLADRLEDVVADPITAADQMSSFVDLRGVSLTLSPSSGPSPHPRPMRIRVPNCLLA